MKPPTATADPGVSATLVPMRDDVVTIRLNAEELAAWTKAAKEAQRTLSDWIRLTVNATLPAPKPKRKARR